MLHGVLSPVLLEVKRLKEEGAGHGTSDDEEEDGAGFSERGEALAAWKAGSERRAIWDRVRAMLAEGRAEPALHLLRLHMLEQQPSKQAQEHEAKQLSWWVLSKALAGQLDAREALELVRRGLVVLGAAGTAAGELFRVLRSRPLLCAARAESQPGPAEPAREMPGGAADEGVEPEPEPARYWRAVKTATIRKEFELDSAEVGRLERAEVIEVLEAREMHVAEEATPIIRLRFGRGWTSTTARSGNLLLVPDDSSIPSLPYDPHAEAERDSVTAAEWRISARARQSALGVATVRCLPIFRRHRGLPPGPLAPRRIALLEDESGCGAEGIALALFAAVGGRIGDAVAAAGARRSSTVRDARRQTTVSWKMEEARACLDRCVEMAECVRDVEASHATTHEATHGLAAIHAAMLEERNDAASVARERARDAAREAWAGLQLQQQLGAARAKLG